MLLGATSKLIWRLIDGSVQNRTETQGSEWLEFEVIP